MSTSTDISHDEKFLFKLMKEMFIPVYTDATRSHKDLFDSIVEIIRLYCDHIAPQMRTQSIAALVEHCATHGDAIDFKPDYDGMVGMSHVQASCITYSHIEPVTVQERIFKDKENS